MKIYETVTGNSSPAWQLEIQGTFCHGSTPKAFDIFDKKKCVNECVTVMMDLLESSDTS